MDVFLREGGGIWGYSDIFIYTGLGPFEGGGSKILNFSIFFWGGGGLQKNEYFGAIKILRIFLGGHHKTGLVLGPFL